MAQRLNRDGGPVPWSSRGPGDRKERETRAETVAEQQGTRVEPAAVQQSTRPELMVSEERVELATRRKPWVSWTKVKL